MSGCNHEKCLRDGCPKCCYCEQALPPLNRALLSEAREAERLAARAYLPTEMGKIMNDHDLAQAYLKARAVVNALEKKDGIDG